RSPDLGQPRRHRHRPARRDRAQPAQTHPVPTRPADQLPRPNRPDPRPRAAVILTIQPLYPSLPLAVLAGGAAAALASVVIGWLSIRHTRIYFSMLTLAFGMMVYSILFKWRSVTGGDDGIVGVPRGVLGIPGAGLELASLGLFYYAVLVVVVVEIGR